jgi:hypothetical protein
MDSFRNHLRCFQSAIFNSVISLPGNTFDLKEFFATGWQLLLKDYGFLGNRGPDWRNF